MGSGIRTADGSAASEHHFGVTRRDPATARQVTVQFAEEVVAAASAEAGRPLADDHAFWRRQGASSRRTSGRTPTCRLRVGWW